MTKNAKIPAGYSLDAGGFDLATTGLIMISYLTPNRLGHLLNRQLLPIF